MKVAAKTLLDVLLPGLSLTPRTWYNETVHPDTDAPFEEHVIAFILEANMHLEFANQKSLWNAVTLETSC